MFITVLTLPHTVRKSFANNSWSGLPPVQVGLTSAKVGVIAVGPFHIPHDVIQKSSSVMRTTADNMAGDTSGIGLASGSAAWSS